MTTFPRLFIFQLLLLFPLISYCQTEGEWLVEMNTATGSFGAVGPMLTDVYTIFGNLQCKDEANGQYIFVKAPASFVSVDITNAQIIDETPYPLGIPNGFWGFYCFQNCDSLLLIQLDPATNRTYVAFFDRFNGTELMQFGDSIPNVSPDPWNVPTVYHGFDRVNNLLYLYSEEISLLRVMDIPSGEIINTVSTNISPMFLVFDEINNKLYALEDLNNLTYRLLVFDSELGDFVQIGNNFTSISHGYHTSTIDGNNQRMFVTRNDDYLGSYMMSIDLNTGALLADIQTMPGDPDFSPFGGPNTLNGQYLNSTDQLITLHYGEGERIITSTIAQRESELKARVFPNPNQGEFKLELDGYSGELYGLKIVNLKGQIVYENSNLRKGESLDLDLSSGYYIANVLDTKGTFFERIPFLVDSKQ